MACMAYLVLAYPKLQQADYDWIQNYRRQNDVRYFSVVEPHVTLVFAMHDIAQDEFVHEVEKQSANVSAFDVQFNVATINQDDSGEYFHEFLVPDTGYSNIVKLHDKLYADKFAPSLRYDIDFIPHIGIGNSDTVHESKKRIDNLNAQGISISGQITDLDIVEYKDGVITNLHKVALAV